MTRSAYKRDFGAAEVDSSLGQIAGLDHVVVVGVVEQRLGRDAADVEAGAAQRRVLLDANSLERKKRGYCLGSQRRIDPNKPSLIGLLQPIADAVKLFIKKTLWCIIKLSKLSFLSYNEFNPCTLNLINCTN